MSEANGSGSAAPGEVTVGQSTVITVNDSLDKHTEDSASLDGSFGGGEQNRQWIGDVSGLINNNVSKALGAADGGQNGPQDIQKCLETLGFQVDRFEDEEETNTAQPSMVKASSENRDSDHSHKTWPSTKVGDVTLSATDSGRESGRQLSQMLGSEAQNCILSERSMMKSIFKFRVNRYEIQQQHLALGRVMKNIFPADTSERVKSSISSTSFIPTNPVTRFMCNLRLTSLRIVSNGVFAGFFLFLTCYALFSPDMVARFGTRSQDEAFAIVNAVVFVLFFIELVLLIWAYNRYYLSLPFVLDVISLLSILGDTWFFSNGGWLDESEARLSRMARSSRMMRLARIMRVARVTKLIPRLMRLLRKQNLILAKGIFMRRLWRVFLFLDTDCDGLISSFDLKIFYLATMQECPHMMQHPRLELLGTDAVLLAEVSSHAEDEESGSLDFDQFSKIMVSTALGKDLIQFHLTDVEQEAGVWTLTQKLSDRTALKVCAGILVLVLAMAILETDVIDGSVIQGLAQLALIATAEHELRGRGAPVTEYLCNHVQIYIDRLAKVSDQVMFLYLDGRSYWENGRCLHVTDTVDVRDRIAAIMEASDVRVSEVVQSCWPGSCEAGAAYNSTALVDRSAQADSAALWRLFTIVLVIVLLLIFVYVLNMKINMFSGNLLQPLRSLVDDMMAMSCLELVHLEAELPVEKPKSVQVAEELQHLETAFKGMRRAIRSWSMYVPPCVVERLYQTGIEATIGVAKCNTTILFVDIDGFEDVCRDLSPKEVLDLLSHALGRISDVIHKYQGTLLEFIGDEVLAVFNTPNTLKHHTCAGVLSAQEVHKVVENLPPLDLNGNQVSIQCRCGVHTAWILAGNIGSHKRMKYGLLGDGINLTARLKGLNSRYRTRTLASDSVINSLAETQQSRRFEVRPLDLVAVKGKKQPITVYEVLVCPKGMKEDVGEAARKHSEGFKLYQERKFGEAKALFEEVSRILVGVMQSTDDPAKMMISRCATYMREPPPPEWDGIEWLTKKHFAIEPQATEPKADAPAALAAPVMGASDEPRLFVEALEPEASPSRQSPAANGQEHGLCPCATLTGVPRKTPSVEEGGRPGSGAA